MAPAPLSFKTRGGGGVAAPPPPPPSLRVGPGRGEWGLYCHSVGGEILVKELHTCQIVYRIRCFGPAVVYRSSTVRHGPGSQSSEGPHALWRGGITPTPPCPRSSTIAIIMAGPEHIMSTCGGRLQNLLQAWPRVPVGAGSRFGHWTAANGRARKSAADRPRAVGGPPPPPGALCQASKVLGLDEFTAAVGGGQEGRGLAKAEEPRPASPQHFSWAPHLMFSVQQAAVLRRDRATYFGFATHDCLEGQSSRYTGGISFVTTF